MEHNLYDNDTDDYYDDASDTLMMDLSDICNKLDDSEEENESKRVQPNGSPCANNHCSTRYEQSFRHNKHTHTNQKAATDKHSRHNH